MARFVKTLAAILTATAVAVVGAAPAASAAGPSADRLRAAVSGCDIQLSDADYSEDDGGPATISVCRTDSAVHWKADLDVDCDGRPTPECNENTDPWFQPETAFVQSDGQPLVSAELPYIVVPLPSHRWDYTTAGITGGTVAAVTYQDRVIYAVVGDLGPSNIIGEGSYALAEALGIDPDPATGGVEGAVVDFILFPGVTVDPIEDHGRAVSVGEQAANALVG